jgi:hypothetical protein
MGCWTGFSDRLRPAVDPITPSSVLLAADLVIEPTRCPTNQLVPLGL